MKRPGAARLLSFFVAALVAAGTLADVPRADATDHGLTTFSAPLGVAPDPATPGVYKGTVVIGWHANDPCKHWEFNISGAVPAFVQGSGSSTQEITTSVALLGAGQTVTVSGSVLCRFGSLDMPLATFPTVTLTAPPAPPLLPSQLTNEQKADLNRGAAVTGALGLSIGLVATVLFAVACPPCALIGAFAAGVGTGLGLVSFYAWYESADPPDPNYTVIDQPRVVTEPTFAPGQGISDDLAAAMNAVLQNIADQVSLERSFLVSMEREWGAQLAGAGDWETKQAIAVRDYASRTADALARGYQLRVNAANLIDAMTSSGLPTDVSPYVATALPTVLANPYPDPAPATFAQLGLSAAELALARQRAQVLVLGDGQLAGKVTSVLRDDDGTSTMVSDLRALAAKGLPPPGPSKLPMPAPGRGGNGVLKGGPCLTAVPSKGCSIVKGISGAAFSVISADGRSMYIGGRDEGSIGVFRRNLVTGALTQLPGKKGCVHDQSRTVIPGCGSARALAGVSQLAVSRDGRTLVAAARGSNALTVFKRAKDGSLTFVQCFRDSHGSGDPHCRAVLGLEDSQSVVIAGDGRNVYATGGGNATLAIFGRSAKTGKLTPTGCVTSSTSPTYASCGPAPVLDGVNRLLLAPNGRRLFVAAEGSGAVSDFARDPRTGKLRLLGCIGGDDGSVNPACAAGRAVRTPQALTLSPDGRELYVTVLQGIATLLVNPVTGELSQPPGTAACLSFNENHDPDCGIASALDGAFGIALAPDGHEAYVGSYSSNAVTQYTRDLTTGVLKPISRCLSLDTQGCAHVRGLQHAGWVTLSPDGRFVYVNAPYSSAVVTFARRLPLALPLVVKPKVKAAHGVVRVLLACPKKAYGGCYGTLAATHAGKVGVSVAYTIAAGKRFLVAVPVAATWRKGTSLAVVAREPAGGRRKGRLALSVR